MKSVIEMMWYGNIDSQKNMSISDNPEIKQLISYMVRHMEELTDTLTDKKKELLKSITIAVMSTRANTTKQYLLTVSASVQE